MAPDTKAVNIDMTAGKIYVVGIGPGDKEYMTGRALAALEESDLIVGYEVYTELVKPYFPEKEYISTGMGAERERCELCREKASEGKTISLVCSGDAQIYGMASLMIETVGKKNRPRFPREKRTVPDSHGKEEPSPIPVVVAGITAAASCGALLGAPLGNDFVTISLSDYLTPTEVIEKRLEYAAKGDFVIAIYNPASRSRPDHLRRACDVLLRYIEAERPCGYVENAGREGESANICTLGELRDAKVNMFNTVFVGNSTTCIVDTAAGPRLVTPRGYRYPCPCCGKLTLTQEPGSYEICPVCGWEDDPAQRRDPDLDGGANKRSLNQSKEDLNNGHIQNET